MGDTRTQTNTWLSVPSARKFTKLIIGVLVVVAVGALLLELFSTFSATAAKLQMERDRSVASHIVANRWVSSGADAADVDWETLVKASLSDVATSSPVLSSGVWQQKRAAGDRNASSADPMEFLWDFDGEVFASVTAVTGSRASIRCRIRDTDAKCWIANDDSVEIPHSIGPSFSGP